MSAEADFIITAYLKEVGEQKENSTHEEQSTQNIYSTYRNSLNRNDA